MFWVLLPTQKNFFRRITQNDKNNKSLVKKCEKMHFFTIFLDFWVNIFLSFLVSQKKKIGRGNNLKIFTKKIFIIIGSLHWKKFEFFDPPPQKKPWFFFWRGQTSHGEPNVRLLLLMVPDLPPIDLHCYKLDQADINHALGTMIELQNSGQDFLYAHGARAVPKFYSHSSKKSRKTNFSE